jgi:uncharacterized protein (DUF342 family)
MNNENIVEKEEFVENDYEPVKETAEEFENEDSSTNGGAGIVLMIAGAATIVAGVCAGAKWVYDKCINSDKHQAKVALRKIEKKEKLEEKARKLEEEANAILDKINASTTEDSEDLSDDE